MLVSYVIRKSIVKLSAHHKTQAVCPTVDHGQLAAAAPHSLLVLVAKIGRCVESISHVKVTAFMSSHLRKLLLPAAMKLVLNSTISASRANELQDVFCPK